MVKSLFEKIRDQNFKIKNDRTRRELEISLNVLSDDELREVSSIKTAFYMARQKIIEEHIKVIDPSLYSKIKNSNNKVPIFELVELSKSS